jgi:hypothetical protein
MSKIKFFKKTEVTVTIQASKLEALQRHLRKSHTYLMFMIPESSLEQQRYYNYLDEEITRCQLIVTGFLEFSE